MSTLATKTMTLNWSWFRIGEGSLQIMKLSKETTKQNGVFHKWNRNSLNATNSGNLLNQ